MVSMADYFKMRSIISKCVLYLLLINKHSISSDFSTFLRQAVNTCESSPTYISTGRSKLSFRVFLTYYSESKTVKSQSVFWYNLLTVRSTELIHVLQIKPFRVFKPLWWLLFHTILSGRYIWNTLRAVDISTLLICSAFCASEVRADMFFLQSSQRALIWSVFSSKSCNTTYLRWRSKIRYDRG